MATWVFNDYRKVTSPLQRAVHGAILEDHLEATTGPKRGGSCSFEQPMFYPCYIAIVQASLTPQVYSFLNLWFRHKHVNCFKCPCNKTSTAAELILSGDSGKNQSGTHDPVNQIVYIQWPYVRYNGGGILT